MGFGNNGKAWTPDTLRTYLKSVSRPLWVRGITLHHCAEPSLKQRPNGFQSQHIQNLKDFYQHEKGWSSAPHLFIDEDQAWGLCPFNEVGVHAKSFNRTHLGFEVLGDYDSEDPNSGRGLQCWQTTFACVKVVLEWLGLPCNESAVNFHRDDPKTSKSCPGHLVSKQWVLDGISRSSSVVSNPNEIKWLVQFLETGQNMSALDRLGRPFVPIRESVKFFGGDEGKIVVSGSDYEYDGHDLEFAYSDLGTGMAPVREIVDALGLRVVDIRDRIVTVGKK